MDNDAFKGEPYGERAAWVWLIENAAWKDTRTRIDSKMVPIARGQLSVSLRFLGLAWCWHRNRVQRFLRLLASEAMIGTEIGTGRTTITICNYGAYQADQPDAGTENGTETGQKRDTSGTKKKNVKKEEEDSEAYASGAGAPPADPVKEMFDLGVAVLGQSARSLVGKARKQHGDLATMEALLAVRAAAPSQPVEFFIGCLNERERRHGRLTPAAGIYAGFADALRDREADCRPDSEVVVPLLGNGRA